MLIWILGASLLSIAAMLGAAGVVLAVREGVRARLVSNLLSYAVGTLLGAAFLGLLPHALEHGERMGVLGTALGGIVLFFALEKLVLWRHCHEGRCETHGAAGQIVLVGDALHNFVDGVVIAAAFVTALPLGVATTLAVVAHELPQELGDFVILLDTGYRPGTAVALNTLSSATTPVGALLAYVALAQVRAAVPYLLALSAASFIYIAAADLIPGLHRPEARRNAGLQVALIVAGVLTILGLETAH